MESSRGTILRLTKLTDSSLIVTWLTVEHGLIQTVARGARRPKSAFAGKIDLFVAAELEWQRARKGNLHHLRELMVTDYRLALRKNYRDTMAASYFGKLLTDQLEEDFALPECAALLRRALFYLADKGVDRQALLHFEKELAKILGHGSRTARGGGLTDLSPSCMSARQRCLDMLKS